ncbi:hypothetical protein [uncultured Lacinutrix sp.]|uniref:hypothetical protein n=1 Tax=uncultured Lacinutrix sp. TaxID=574032 RepID=UPI0026132948|nr:hypothetical protein [uncultured Lacinutrix sp.]
MRKQLLFQLILCVFISIGNITKDLFPLGKTYLKNYACQFDIQVLLNEEILNKIKSNLSQEELEDIKKLKDNYCKTYL